MEVAATIRAYTLYLVKSVGPVYTEQTNHWKEDTCSDANGLFQVERIKVSDAAPAVATFCKDKAKDVGACSQHEGIAEFYRESGIGIAHIAAWGEGTVVVTSQTDGFCRIQ